MSSGATTTFTKINVILWLMLTANVITLFIPRYKLLNRQLPIFSTRWNHTPSLRIWAYIFVSFILSFFLLKKWLPIHGIFPQLIYWNHHQLYCFNFMCVSNNPAVSLCSTRNNYSTVTTQSLQNSLHASHCYCIPHYKIVIRSFCKNVSVIECNNFY